MNWDDYPNFSEEEFKCSCCGESKMDPRTMAKIQELRTAFGKPLVVTSGYRCPNHPNEISRTEKGKVGSHGLGMAADFAVNGSDAYKLINLAFQLNFTGIGVNQKGNGRFIHLDDVQEYETIFRPVVWSY